LSIENLLLTPGLRLGQFKKSMALPVNTFSGPGVLKHGKISNSKHQNTNKFQIPISNNQNRFGILKLGTRPKGGESKRSADNFGHCDLFEI
jgi:hypothetical protein